MPEMLISNGDIAQPSVVGQNRLGLLGVRMKRSLRVLNSKAIQIVKQENRRGHPAALIKGKFPGQIIVIDALEKTVRLMTVKVKGRSNFRIDMDTGVHAGWTVITSKILYSGKVKD
jgi:hypothetical protein